MYYTGMNPFTGKPIFVEKEPRLKNLQKDIITEPADGKRIATAHRMGYNQSHDKRINRAEAKPKIVGRRPSRRP
jgi:hypothetical protein